MSVGYQSIGEIAVVAVLAALMPGNRHCFRSSLARWGQETPQPNEPLCSGNALPNRYDDHTTSSSSEMLRGSATLHGLSRSIPARAIYPRHQHRPCAIENMAFCLSCSVSMCNESRETIQLLADGGRGRVSQ